MITISDGDNNTVSSVSRELEEENAPADSTTALTVTTQESPASIIANTHPSINLITTDGNGAATLTFGSSCTSSGQDGAAIPRTTMPRVRISLTSHYLLSSYYIGH